MSQFNGTFVVDSKNGIGSSILFSFELEQAMIEGGQAPIQSEIAIQVTEVVLEEEAPLHQGSQKTQSIACDLESLCCDNPIDKFMPNDNLRVPLNQFGSNRLILVEDDPGRAREFHKMIQAAGLNPIECLRICRGGTEALDLMTAAIKAGRQHAYKMILVNLQHKEINSNFVDKMKAMTLTPIIGLDADDGSQSSLTLDKVLSLPLSQNDLRRLLGEHGLVG